MADNPRMIGINHVAISVGDLDTALAFFESVFTFDLRSRSATHAFIDMGDQFLAIAETEAASVATDTNRHIGLVVDDKSAVRDRLMDTDVEILESSGLDFRDPWGNRFQVIAYEDIQFTKADHVYEGMELPPIEKQAGPLERLAAKGMAPHTDE